MSYQYLGLKRLKTGMQLSIQPAALVEFGVIPIALWLVTTSALYRRSVMPPIYSDEAQVFIDQNEAHALQAIDSLSAAGKLLMESVLLACEMPTRGDMDKNLALIAAAYGHAVRLKDLPVTPYKISYSLRKHRDLSNTRLMTVRTDVVADLGVEAAGWTISVLRDAIARDLNLKINILNTREIFGDHYRESATASPTYVDKSVFFIRMILVDYLYKNLSLAKAKESLGAIKTLSDYFQSLEQPRPTES